MKSGVWLSEFLHFEGLHFFIIYSPNIDVISGEHSDSMLYLIDDKRNLLRQCHYRSRTTEHRKQFIPQAFTL